MKVFVFILAIILFSGCLTKNKIPAGVLSQQQMRLVMWDLMRVDEFANNFIIKDTTLNRKDESIKLYEQVFERHGTSRAEFKKSLSFYQARPDLFKVVTDSLRTYEKMAMDNKYNTSGHETDTIKKKSPNEAIKPVTPN